MGVARGLSAVADAQVPPPGRVVLDHVAWFLADLDEAADELEKLGFALTPRSEQMLRPDPDAAPVPAGTANRTAMLARGYLEFLGATGDTENAAKLREAMARHVGLHLLCFGTAEPGRAHARLAQRGFAPPRAVDLRREIGLPGGGTGEARFAVVRAGPGAMAEGRVQFVHHLTPELLWQERWLRHANGARALAGAVVAVADLDEAVSRWRRFTGLPARGDGEMWVLPAARGQVILGETAAIERIVGVAPPALPWIAGPLIDVADLAKTAKFLARAGAAVLRRTSRRLVVGLPPALGGAIVFQQGTGAEG